MDGDWSRYDVQGIDQNSAAKLMWWVADRPSLPWLPRWRPTNSEMQLGGQRPWGRWDGLWRYGSHHCRFHAVKLNEYTRQKNPFRDLGKSSLYCALSPHKIPWHPRAPCRIPLGGAYSALSAFIAAITISAVLRASSQFRPQARRLTVYPREKNSISASILATGCAF